MWPGGTVRIKKILIGDDTRGRNVFVEEYWRGKWTNDGNRYIEFRASFRLPSRHSGNNIMLQAGKDHVQKTQDNLDEEAKKQRWAFDSGKGLGMMRKCGSGLKKKKMIKKAKQEKKASTKKNAKSIKEWECKLKCDQNMITSIDQRFKEYKGENIEKRFI